MTADYSVIFTSGTESLTVYPQTCSIVRPVCSDTLQHQDGSASITVPFAQEILSFIVARDTFKATVKEGSNTVFTGTVSTDLEWEDKGRLASIDKFAFTINDNSELLQQNTTDEIALINTTVGAVITHLCTTCGVTVASDTVLPSTALQAFILDEGKSCYTALSNLCFEHCCSFYFNNLGELCLFHFDNIPENPTALDDSILQNQLAVKKLKRKYTGIKIGYSTLTKKDNELVYFKNEGYESDGSSKPIVLQAGVFYPYDSDPAVEQENGQVFQTFESGYATSVTKHNGEKTYQRSGGTTLLYTTNQHVTEDWTGSIKVNRTGYASKKSSVRLCNSGTSDATLYQLSIRADAWYKEAASSVTAGITTTQYSYDTEYVYTAAAATALASALYRYNTCGQYKLTSYTDDAIQPGTYRTISTGETGFAAAALAICSTYDPDTGIYTTDWITISDAPNSIVKVASSGSQSIKGLDGTNGADAYTMCVLDGTIVLQASPTGDITDQRAIATIKVYKGLEQMTIRLGTMPVVAGLKLKAVQNKVYIDFASGTTLTAKGTINIPVRILLGDNYKVLGVSGEYILGISGETILGQQENDSADVQLIAQISWSKSIKGDSAGRYQGTFSNAASFPTSVVVNDYLLYTGSSTTTYKKGRCYYYTGSEWKLDSNWDHNMAAMKDMVSLAYDDETDTSSPAVSFLSGLVTNKAFIKKIAAQTITLLGNGSINGSGNGGSFEITSSGKINAKKAYFEECTLGGFLYANNTPFMPIAMVNLYYADGSVGIVSAKNVASVVRAADKAYSVYFAKPIKLPAHVWRNNNHYVDIIAIGNAHDTFDNGFCNPIHITSNWVRQSIEGQGLTIDSEGFATIPYVILYFPDNNNDQLEDPMSAQVFVFASDSDIL